MSGSRQHRDEPVEYVCRTLMGLEPLVAAEVEALGATEVKTGRRSVTFHIGEAGLYTFLQGSRFAVRVLRPVFRFKSKGPDDLHAKAVRLNWSQWVDARRSMALDVTVHSEYFPHDQFAMFRLKDAMSDHFRDRMKGGGSGHLNINRTAPEQLIHLHIAGEDVTISLDLVGKDALFKRGYRAPRARAPLNEVLTAGLLALAGWKPGMALVDPMCGSGTFSIEAGLWTAGSPFTRGVGIGPCLACPSSTPCCGGKWGRQPEWTTSYARPSSIRIGTSSPLGMPARACGRLDWSTWFASRWPTSST